MASCVVITAVICVLITTVATIVSFATPNWVKFENDAANAINIKDTLCQCTNCDCGMWLYCTDRLDESIDNCRWFFSEEFEVEKELPSWFKAVQGLMSGAVASSLLSLLIGLFSLCCYCKNCNPHLAAGAFINLTFLLLAVAVSLFGAKAHLDYDMEVLTQDNGPVAIFSWSFWVAVGAGAMALLSSILYFCVGRGDQHYV